MLFRSDEEYGGVGLELEWAVHHRVVLIVQIVEQVPRVERVEALVMVHCANANVPQSHDQGDHDQRAETRKLPPSDGWIKTTDSETIKHGLLAA